MLSLVSLFTGAGGLDLGMEAAGYDVRAAVEFDDDACETLRANRNWPVIEGNIHDVTSEEILDKAKAKRGEIALLVGGPPCQPFSKSGYWRLGDTKRLEDPRADTLTAYLRVLRDLQPKAFLLENVEGLIYKGKDEGLQHLRHQVAHINRTEGTNYSFERKVLNAADYGVPQIRERVFIVGARDGKRFTFPKETHIDPDEHGADMFSKFREPWMNCWDAIGDLNDTPRVGLAVGGQWGDLLPSIPEGNNYLWHTDRGGGLRLFGWRRRYWSFLLKLGKNKPSWTVQAQPGSAVGPFHWKSRRLSMRELCRIQTFPDDFQITGTRTEVQRQLGNAVPSLLAEVLGRAMREQLLDSPPETEFPELRVTRRLPLPPPEPITEVPEKYHCFIGDHPAHPGTGKGNMVYGLTG